MLTKSFLSLAIAVLLPASAHAARAVMENISASNNTVFVDTQTKRVHLSTQAYGDGVGDVSLYTTSNVVVGDNNAIVLYATGSFRASSLVATSLSSSPLLNVSTISAPGGIRVYVAGGSLALDCDSSKNCIFGGATGNRGELDVYSTGGPSFNLRRNDTSVLNGNQLGVVNFWSEDSSTGGTAIKSRIRSQALADYGSTDQHHPAGMFFGISNTGGNNATDYMVLTATGLVVEIPVVGRSSITTSGGVFGNGSGLTSLTAENVSAGTLGASVIASSVAATGVGGSKQTCGSSTISCSFDVNPDGRITRVSSAAISGASASLTTVSTGTFTAFTDVFIASVAPNKFYTLTVAYVQNTSNGTNGLRFNNDTGTNYRYGLQFFTDNGAGAGSGANTSSAYLALVGQPTDAGFGGVFVINFHTTESSAKVDVAFTGHHTENSRRSAVYGGGFYSGGSDLSVVTFITSAGTVTGYWKLEETP